MDVRTAKRIELIAVGDAVDDIVGDIVDDMVGDIVGDIVGKATVLVAIYMNVFEFKYVPMETPF